MTWGARRGLCVWWAAACAGLGAPALGAPLTIVARNSVTIGPSAVNQFGTLFTIAGMSGVCHEAGDVFLAVMDNSNKVVRLRVGVSPTDGLITGAEVLPSLSVGETRDFEGVALVPPGGGPGIMLADETMPGVTRWDSAAGTLFSSLGVPPVFAARRANLGFESMTSGTGPSGLPELWTCNEEALTVDGAVSSASAGTTVRLLRYVNAGAGPVAVQQFAYVTDPWHGSAISGARSGVNDLVLLPDGRLLAVERSLALSAEGLFRTRIYEVSFSAATDVSALPALLGASYTSVGKTLLWTGYEQNIEGVCVGQAIGSPGSVALVGVVDDGDPISENRVYSWQLSGLGPAACAFDLNRDGQRDTADLVLLLSRFGQPMAAGGGLFPAGDLNFDGAVNTADLVLLLNSFGRACPG